jgi:hypothetical protein
MTERFGESAAKLSSAASVLLGWRPGEFWNATPAELALAVMAGELGAEVPDTTRIEALKRRFPDKKA